ncbi:MAG: hypothetical protein ACE5EX_07075 [Phycisphaerae bacterium]
MTAIRRTHRPTLYPIRTPLIRAVLLCVTIAPPLLAADRFTPELVAKLRGVTAAELSPCCPFRERPIRTRTEGPGLCCTWWGWTVSPGSS